ncbi:MAG TPA: hypothetical protein VE959_01830 [Bryobacteraceae bacterium]|nr:hypothetical protein [Bryobacteraceae bacterium]
MKTCSQSSKLVELRAKTDRQLYELISSRLDAGLNFARWAAQAHASGRWTSEDIFQDGASKAYAEACRLLPWVDGLRRAQRAGLEFKLEQLRRRLEDLSAGSRLQAQTA